MISGEFNTLSRQTSELERLRSRLLSRTALCGVVSLGMFFGASSRDAKAGPEGTTVVSGGVTVQSSGTHTQFNQTTNTAILNHSSFDIRANESVHFQQPSANALAVNRVVGSDVSTTIAGKLTATGNVWVLNPSGVAISSGAQINVNGLVATTSEISDDAILAGRASGSFAFSGAADGTSVTNAGTITAGDGHVVLVAPVVENSGTITTQGSEIALGAGSGFTVDMGLDGLTRFEVQPGSGVSLTNTGNLSAQGGAVFLSADAAGSVEGAVVSVGGQVEATRIENRGGQIVISAGENGTTEVTGTISAAQTVGAGGQIVVTGEEVEIAETAVIDASGATDGGKVEIGGGLQGRAVESPVVRTASASAPAGAPLPVAKRTTVAEGAVIRANAGANGNGGEVIVWSDVGTEFFGTIQARGGEISGDGGFAEVSGKDTLFFSGEVDLAAVNGAGGNLLLDPDNITISVNADAANNLNVGTLVALLDAGTSVTVNTSSGLNGLNGQGGDGTGMDAGTITVSDDITTNIVNGGAGASLTLVADSTIDVNGNITDTGEALSVNLQAGGTVTINSANSINVDGDVDITSVGNTTLSSITAATLDVTTSSNGSILQQGSSTIVVSGNTSLLADGTGDITLGEATNDFNTVDASGTAITLVDTNSIELDVITATGNLAVTANTTGGNITDSGGSISVGGTTSLTGDVINIDAGQTGLGQNTFIGDVSINAGQIVTFQAAAGLNIGNITITNGTGVTNDLFTQTGLMNVNGTVSVAGTSVLQLTALNAGSIINQTAGTITADTLTIRGNPTSATFNQAGNDINTLSSNNSSGNGASITFTDVDDVAISGVDVVALTVTATDVDITGASTVAGTLSVTNSAGDATDLLATSSATAGTFDIDNADLANLTAATLAVNSGNGAIAVNGVDAVSNGTVGSISLDAGTEEIDFTGSASTFTALTTSSEDIVASVGVSVTNTLSATNSEGDAVQIGGNATGGPGNFEIAQAELDNLTVGTLAVATSAGDIEVTEVVSTNIGAVSLAAGTGNVDFNTGSGGGGTTSTFAALTISSATNITDSDNNALSITGNADFNATGDIILDQLAEIGGEIDAAATNIDLRSSSGSFDLDVVTAGGTLFLVNPGNITDTATSVISVTGATLLDPDLAINVDRTGTHQFGGVVQLSTGQITQFASTGNIVFGNSAATTAGVTNTITTAGNVEFDGTFSTEATADLTLELGAGNITQDAGLTTTITTDVLTINSAGGTVNVTLDDATNDFNTVQTGTTALTSLTIQDSDGIDLNGINTGALTVTANGAGDITDTGVTTVTGASSFTATGNTVQLDSANLFTGAVSATGDTVILVDADELSLGTIAAANSLSATSSGGDLVIDNALSVDGGDIALSATANIDINANVTTTTSGNITISSDTDDTAGGNIDIAGGTSIIAAGTLDVDAGASTGQMIDTGAGDITLTSGGAFDFENTLFNETNLILTAGGGVTDAGATNGVSISGTASITTTVAASAVELDNAANDFGNTVSIDTTNIGGVAGGVVTIQDANSVTIGAIAATSLSGTALAGDVIVSSAIDVNAGDVALTATNTIDVDANVITRTSGNITLTSDSDASGGGDIDLAGGTSVVAAGTLDVETNTGSMIDSGSGTVTLNSAGVFDFETTNFSSTDLALTAAGTVSQTGSVTVAGNTSISASGQTISLSDANNDFGTGLDLLGASADIQDANAIVMGNVSITGDASIEAGGITDLAAGTDASDGAGVVIGGTTTLTSTGAVVLDDVDNDFNTVLVSASGQNVTLIDADDVDLGNVEAAALTVTGGGNITDSGVLTVTGASDFTATGFDITLDSANLFTGAVSASGNAVTLVDADTLTLGTISATSLSATSSGGNLAVDNTITIDSGSITLTASDTVDVNANITTTTSGDIVITGDSNVDGTGGIDLAGGTSVVAAGTLDVETNNGQMTDTGSGTVTLTSGGVFDFESTNFDNTNLAVTAAGNVTQSAAVSVTGTTAVTTTVAASTVDLSNTANDFGGAVSVDTTNGGVVTGGVVTLVDANSLPLGAISATSLTATSSGGDLVIDNAITIDGGDIALNASANVDINANVTTTTSGNITITSDTDVAGGGDIDLLAGTSVTAVGTLDLEANGGTVTDSGGADAVTLTSGGVFDFETTTFDNAALVVSAAGTVSQTGVINVTGNTSINAAGNAIELSDSSNDFGTGLDLRGSSADIQDINAIVLGDVSITGDASIEAVGITDVAAGTDASDGVGVLIAGTTTLTSTDAVTLDDVDNDFATVIASAAGQAVTLVDADGVAIGASSAATLDVTSTDIDLTGAVALTGASTLTNSAGDDVTVGGANDANEATYELAQSSLDNLTSTGLTVVSNNGNITSAAADTTTTTNIDGVTFTAGTGTVDFGTGTSSFEALTVTASSGITDTGSVSVTGATDLISTGTIDLQTNTNDFNSLAISASGQSATIQDANGITLAAIDAGSLDVTAGGNIIDTASVITVTGAASFTATGNDVVLDTNHEFGSTVNAVGTNVTLNDANDIALGNITATNMNVATAGNGNVNQTGSTTVNVSGNTSINAGSGNITLTETTNDFADVGSSGNIDLTGGTVSIVDADSLRLNGTLTVGAFSGTALAGQLDLIQALSVTGGDITLNASESVFVRQNVTTTTSGNIAINADTNASGGGLVGEGVIVVDGATIDSAGTLVVDSGASLLQDNGTGGATLNSVGNLTIDGAEVSLGDLAMTSSAGDVIVNGALNVTGNNLTASAAGTVDVNANVTTTTSGNITLTGDSNNDATGGIDLAGGTSVVAAGVLDVETNSGQMTDSGSGTVTLNSGGAFEFESTTFDNTNLVAIAAGAVTQEAASTVSISGNTSINAGANAITLSEATNDFGTGLDLRGASADIQDANAIVLSDISITGNASIEAGAGITDLAAGTDASDSVGVLIAGTTSLTAAGEILLDDVDNDFGTVVVSAASQNVTLVDADEIDLGNVQAGALTVTGGGNITDSGILTVTGISDFTAIGSDITLDSANLFTGQVNANGNTVTLVDADTLTLGTISATTLSATSSTGDLVVNNAINITNGDILLSASENVDINANVTTTTSGNITINSDTDADGGNIDIAGGTSIVAASVLDVDTGAATGQMIDTGAGTITLGSGGAFDFENTLLNEANLVVIANGAVTDTGAVTVTGTTDITTTLASSAVTLDSAANDFGDTVTIDTTNGGTVTGGVVTLQDANSVTLGGVQAVSLSATALGGDVIANTANDIVGDVALTATTNVDINANLTASGGGNITLTSDSDASGGGDIDILGGTSVVATGVLDVETNTGQMTDSGSGTVTLQSGGAFDFENSTIDNTALVVIANGAVTDSGAVTVTGTTDITTTLASSAVTLDSAANDFGDTVTIDTTNGGTVTGGVVTLQDANSVTLGGIQASSLSATALGGDVITNTANDIGGDVALTATTNVDINANLTSSGGGNITLTSDSDAAGGGDIDILGGTSVVAAGVLDVETNTGQMTDSGSGTVTLQSGGAFDFENTSFDTTSLVLTTGGAVTDDGVVTGIFLTNDATITAGAAGEFFDIALDTADLHDFGGVMNLTGEDVTIDDVNAIVLGAVSTNEAAQADADADGTIDTTINTNRGDLIVRAGGTITDSGGAASDGAGLLIEGVASLDANTGASDITLDDVDNDFDQDVDGVSGDALDDVDAIGNNILLVDNTAIALGTVTAGGTLSVTAAGSITDTTGEAVSVTGDTTLNALTTGDFFDIALDNVDTHDFGGAVNATGEEIYLDDANAITLGAISANAAAVAGDATADATLATNLGDLVVLAGGSVTDTSAAINIPGTTSIVAQGTGNFFDIALDTADTHDFGGTVNVTGEDITLDDINEIELGSISTNEAGQADADADSAADTVIGTNRGDLIVLAGGAITDAGGAASDGVGLLIEGTASLEAGGLTPDITLDDVDNDFDQDADGASSDALDDVDAIGRDIVLVDNTAIALGTVTAANGLTVTAGGSITDTAGENVSVTGITSLQAESAGDFFDIQLDNVGHDFVGIVNATAEDMTIADANTIVFGAVTTNSDGSADPTIATSGGDLVVTSVGDITDDDAQAGLQIAGTSTLNSGAANIVLDNRLNDFVGVVNASGTAVTLVDASTLNLGAVSGATLNLTATSGDVTNASNTGDVLSAGAGGAVVSAEQGDVFLSFDTITGNLNVEGGSVTIIDQDASPLTVARAVARDAFALSKETGDIRLTDRVFSGGDLQLVAEQGNVDFSGVPLAAIPTQVVTGAGTPNSQTFSLAGLGSRLNDAVAIAEGDLSISAPNGTVLFPTAGGLNVPVRLISNSGVDVFQNGTGSTNNVLEIEVGQNLTLVAPTGISGALLTLDVPTSGRARIILTGTQTNVAIGETDFVNQAVAPGFDAINFFGTLNADQLLLDVTGILDLQIDGATSLFFVQNTTSVVGSTNFGEGMRIAGVIEIRTRNGGTLEQFAAFGSINGQTGVNAALQFEFPDGTFAPDQNDTLNGCVIGSVSSCTPLGTLVLNLQFETGQFLGITFVDPDEDEDDPFSNRGDEEEWE